MNTELITRPCTLVLRGSSGQEDDYGNKVKDDPTDVETVCEVQQRDATEPAAAGELGRADFDGFLLPSVTVPSTGDALIVEDEQYELVGPAVRVRDPFTQNPSHIEMPLRQTKGAASGGAS